MPKKIVTLFLLLSVIVGRELFLDGSFATHDDLQVMRLFQMHMCLSDGQIPCRYLSEMGFGYGQPTFNYYSAFPYYLGAFFNLLNISYLTTVKLLYFLNLFLAGCFFYKFARSHLSSVASFIAASAFVLVPYRAVDIFVRGALAEITALTLLPLLLYSFYKLSKEPKLSNTLFSSVILFFFLTTHNLTTLISLPLIIVYLLYLCLKNTSSLKHSFLASSLGVGLSAFFLLPVLFERNLINMAGLTSGYLDFHSHFSSLSQLFFDLSWPFEAKPSAFIGVIPSIVLFTSPLTIYFSKKRILPILFLLLTLVFLFMSHAKSSFIWESLPFLSFVQFPWRFLGLVMFGSAFLAGFLLDAIPARFVKVSALVIFTVLLILFLPLTRFESHDYFATDSTILSGKSLVIQSGGGVADYLPVSSKKIPNKPSPQTPSTITGTADIKKFEKRTNYFVIDLEVFSASADVVIPLTYFPNWRVYPDGSLSPLPLTFDNQYGLITVIVPKGKHTLQGFFENTPLRQIGNTISIISLSIIILLYLRSKQTDA